MKITDKNITQVVVFARAKNADVYGNPYASFKAFVCCDSSSYFTHVSVFREMAWGDASEWGVLGNIVCPAINEAFGTSLRADDQRIVYHFRKVSNGRELSAPRNWRVEL